MCRETGIGVGCDVVTRPVRNTWQETCRQDLSQESQLHRLGFRRHLFGE